MFLSMGAANRLSSGDQSALFLFNKKNGLLSIKLQTDYTPSQTFKTGMRNYR